MDLAELLAQIRALSVHVPSLASIVSRLDSTPVKRVKRIKLGSRPLNLGKFPESGVHYAPRIEREAQPILNKRERAERADRYRARIDASAEAEGEAIDRLESVRSAGVDLLERVIACREGDGRASRIMRRFAGNGRGNALSTWHYMRALARSVPVDASDNVRRGELSLVFRQYAYRRAAAQRRWDTICDYFARRNRGEILPALTERTPAWARATKENAETKARRKLQRYWRDMIRAVGAAKVAGVPGAAELYASLSVAKL